MSQEPYLVREIVTIVKEYNPEYGDSRKCECGHSYVRHFDSYEDMDPCGCKHCGCDEFIEVLPGQKTGKDAEDDGYDDGFGNFPMSTEYDNTKWKEIYERWYVFGSNKRKSQDYKF